MSNLRDALMAPDQSPAPRLTMQSPNTLQVAGGSTTSGRETPMRWLDGAIFLFLMLFAILLPHSIKGAHVWKLAFLLWLVKLAVEHRRPWPQPLALPLLAYVILSAISTALSVEPLLSWDRMKIVCIVLVGVVFPQSLKLLSQVRILVFLLILSGLAAAGFTAWQYTYGMGVQVTRLDPGSPLSRAGVRLDDIITRVNGEGVHSPNQFERVVRTHSPGDILRLRTLRGFPFHEQEVFLSREGVFQSGLGTASLQLGRGKPMRAQGTLGMYVVFAEILMEIGCLTWAVLLTFPSRRTGMRVLLALAFFALAAALFATQTRAAATGLALGCLVALLMLADRRSRVWATSALFLFMVCAAAWMQHTRGLHWLDRGDPGTNFRVLMWEDGLRLARQHPWFGVGMETIRLHHQEWNIRGIEQYHVVSHFHSDYVQIAAERGLLTLAGWLWFVVAYGLFLTRLVAKARLHSRFATGVAAGLLAGLLAYLVTSVVHYNLGEEPLVAALFFYYGLAVALDRLLGEPEAIDVA